MALRRFKRMERKRSYRQMGADLFVWDVSEGHGESS